MNSQLLDCTRHVAYDRDIGIFRHSNNQDLNQDYRSTKTFGNKFEKKMNRIYVMKE